MTIVYNTRTFNAKNHHLIALAPLAYYLRNEKLFSWNKILSIINFNHFYPHQNKPALIRITKQFANHHNLEPPISHHARKNMFISYNLVALGMPIKDIYRFQANQFSQLNKIYDRIHTLSKELSIPNPLPSARKKLGLAPVKPNPEPLLFDDPSITTNSFLGSNTYYVTVHVSRVFKIPYFIKRAHIPLLTYNKKKPFRILPKLIYKKRIASAIENAHFALLLAVKHKTPLNEVAFSLGFSSQLSLLQCINMQLAKCDPPFPKLSYKDFIPSP